MEKFNAVNHAKDPAITWQRLYEILIDIMDNTMADTDLAWDKEMLLGVCTPEELKELGIWEWFGFEEEDV